MGLGGRIMGHDVRSSREGGEDVDGGHGQDEGEGMEADRAR